MQLNFRDIQDLPSMLYSHMNYNNELDLHMNLLAVASNGTILVLQCLNAFIMYITGAKICLQ